MDARRSSKAVSRASRSSWVRYFEAWASATTLNPPELSKNQNLERWANHVLFFPAGHGIQLSVNPTLFRGPDGEVMTPSSFVNASKRYHAFVYPPIVPEGHQKIFSLPEQRWNSWWKALRRLSGTITETITKISNTISAQLARYQLPGRIDRFELALQVRVLQNKTWTLFIVLKIWRLLSMSIVFNMGI
ncbi:BQ2448_1297 [Microbotryum intermedium]|uniref:BQ2448_1297 protein n=1 Tax=Microbotryum intermedium TaxID=269621 RepID=A0A238FD16_9BASI|nr:BQ2448_1297 [Microbotryum intermedium]